MTGDKNAAKEFLIQCYEEKYGKKITENELEDRMQRYGTNPCGGI